MAGETTIKTSSRCGACASPFFTAHGTCRACGAHPDDVPPICPTCGMEWGRGLVTFDGSEIPCPNCRPWEAPAYAGGQGRSADEVAESVPNARTVLLAVGFVVAVAFGIAWIFHGAHFPVPVTR